MTVNLDLADSLKQKYLVTKEILKTKLSLHEASEYGQDEVLARFYSSMQLRGSADMQKVEILPPADFQVKISAKGQNQMTLLGFMNFLIF